jgi:phosphate transport system protein
MIKPKIVNRIEAQYTMQKLGSRIAQYDNDLRILNDGVSKILYDTQAAMQIACQALHERDLDKAMWVVSGDDIVDQEEIFINKIVCDLIMKYQPLSLDLRCVLASMHIAWDLERVGDIARSISKRVLTMEGQPSMAVRRLQPLATQVMAQFGALIEVYETNDVAAALTILAEDNNIDGTHSATVADLMEMMEQDASTLRPGVQLLSIAKSLERVGDHITNVAEQILYKIDGRTEFTVRKVVQRQDINRP